MSEFVVLTGGTVENNLRLREMAIEAGWNWHGRPVAMEMSALMPTAYRFDDYARVVRGYDNNPDGSYYRTNYAFLEFLSLEADLPRITERLTGRPTDGTRVNEFVVLTNGREEVNSALKALVIESGWNWGDIPVRRTAYGAVNAYMFAASQQYVSGFNEDDHDGNWYRNNTSITTFLRFPDDQTKIVELLTGKPTMTPQMKDCIVYIHGSPSLAKWVTELAIRAGYKEESIRVRLGRNVLPVALRFGPGGDVNSASDPATYRERQYADWVKFDADVDEQIEKLKEHWGLKESGPVVIKPKTAEEIIPPQLLAIIRAQPQEEMVLGLIRRDLKMVVPKEVQAAGADAIINFVVEEINSRWVAGIPVPEAAQPPLISPQQGAELTIRVTEVVAGLRRWQRYDEVTVRMVVPGNIIQLAIDEDDHSLITNWITENYSQRNVVSREEGDESAGDSEEDAPEYYELVEDDDVSEFLNEQ